MRGNAVYMVYKAVAIFLPLVYLNFNYFSILNAQL